jgi:hypothetical protein
MARHAVVLRRTGRTRGIDQYRVQVALRNVVLLLCAGRTIWPGLWIENDWIICDVEDDIIGISTERLHRKKVNVRIRLSISQEFLELGD